MQDLQEVTQEVHYENYRSERLVKGVKRNNGVAKDEDIAITDKDRILQEKEAELLRIQEELARMQAKIKAQQ
uniref:Septin-type G domain-containing protein n=2 Tax=Phlebotomus papatasi TaxID=29031 RepID=A0A1B0DK82_PHLPP